jgi:EAL domain-containing protein (putative c-di-GMP-specific phosphodiesterase class I)
MQHPNILPEQAPTPYLEHFPELGGPAQRIFLEQLPFRIGRSNKADFVIYSTQVSKEHTEIYRVGPEFYVRDLGSTNGTFVNGQRVLESRLVPGDIVHVSQKEFRFGVPSGKGKEESVLSYTQVLVTNRQPASMIRSREHLCEMLENQYVRVVFQPLVYLDTGKTMGYEALGRGTHSELSNNPSELFGLANQCNLSGELSRILRDMAVTQAAQLPEGLRIFFNLHPSEMIQESLTKSLALLKRTLGDNQQAVIEVHESVVTDVAFMRWLRGRLAELGMGLAYDDFGVGQSRLTELAEVPPDFIKLDRSLVCEIDKAETRQALVQTLCRFIMDLGVQLVAEGIERAEEAQFFRDLGCPLAQGYLFGPPQPSALFRPRPSEQSASKSVLA